MGNKWTEEDLQFLKDNYFNLGAKECALILNRTYEAIKKKAQILGIKGNKLKRFSHEKYEQQLFDIQSEAYPIERYVTNRTSILHTCIKGHIWKARPDSILTRSGCPYCAQFTLSKNKPAILYYIKIIYNNEIFLQNWNN